MLRPKNPQLLGSFIKEEAEKHVIRTLSPQPRENNFVRYVLVPTFLIH